MLSELSVAANDREQTPYCGKNIDHTRYALWTMVWLTFLTNSILQALWGHNTFPQSFIINTHKHSYKNEYKEHCD